MRNRITSVLAALAMVIGLAGIAWSPRSTNAEIVWSASQSEARQPVIKKPFIDKNGNQSRLLATTEYRMYSGADDYIGTAVGSTTGADAVMVKTSQHKTYSHGASSGCTTPPSPCYDTGLALWEMAVTDLNSGTCLNAPAGLCPGSNQIEVGNAVDSGLCVGTASPCLWVSAWVNGVWQGYGPGFVDNPTEAVNARRPGAGNQGTALAVTASGAVPTVFYEYKVSRVNSAKCDGVTTDGTPVQTTLTLGWAVYQQNVGATRLIGCFPHTLWSNAGITWNKIGYVSSFTEAQSVGDGSTPGDAEATICSDGGSGVFGTSTTPSAALRIDDLVFTSPPAGVTPDWSVFTEFSDSSGGTDPGVDPTGVRAYKVGSTDFKAGGPGFNSAGTGTGTIGSC